MRVDEAASEQIYEALACPELDNLKRKQYVQFLIDFYISKTHMKLEPVGFLTGRTNAETYGISNINYNEAMRLKQSLNDAGIEVKYQSSLADRNMIEIMFDATRDQYEFICEKILPRITA